MGSKKDELLAIRTQFTVVVARSCFCVCQWMAAPRKTLDVDVLLNLLCNYKDSHAHTPYIQSILVPISFFNILIKKVHTKQGE